jgi:hypothetical protein
MPRSRRQAGSAQGARAAYTGELLAHTHYTGQSRVEWTFGGAVVHSLVRSPNSIPCLRSH